MRWRSLLTLRKLAMLPDTARPAPVTVGIKCATARLRQQARRAPRTFQGLRRPVSVIFKYKKCLRGSKHGRYMLLFL